MRNTLLATGIILLLGGASGAVWWLQAGQGRSLSTEGPTSSTQFLEAPTTTPIVDTPTATPNIITVGTSTQVLFTVSIPEPTLNLASVNLLRVNPNGNSTIAAQMVDNGQNGDQQPGDKVFTAKLTLNEPQAGDVKFQVSAAFRGILRRGLSLLTPVSVWNVVQVESAFGPPQRVPYPPGWRVGSLSTELAGGIYVRDDSDDTTGDGISISLFSQPINSILLDPNHTLLDQFSHVINGRTWLFVTQAEPTSGLRFYNAFLQTSMGVLVIGGNDSLFNRNVINTIAILYAP